MRWWSELKYIMRKLNRRRAEQEAKEEIQTHLELETREQIEAGFSPEEARYWARRAFGSVALAKEKSREVWGLRDLEILWQDLRYGVRILLKKPGVGLLAIAILAVGIGSTTAMFSITRTVLLKPLAYRDPDRLATLLGNAPQFAKEISTMPVNAQHYLLWRDHSRTLEEIGLVVPDSKILSGIGTAEQITGVRTTANFFHLLGAQPALGRNFAEGEDQAGKNQVVIVSYQFWQNRLSARRDALGLKILLDGQPFEVIGVMPPHFPFPSGSQLSDVVVLPDHTEFWTPLVFTKEQLSTPLGDFDFIAIGRLKPDATIPQVLADLTALEKEISKRYPQPVEINPVVRRLQAAMARDVRLPLLILMAAVSAVLLIVCINLMNLTMVRRSAERRDLAIRMALGAGTGHLLRAAFAESLLLSSTGAILGSILAVGLLRITRFAVPVDLPRIDEFALDPAALLFALGAAVATTLLFGVWPVWSVSRIDPQEVLQGSGRTATETRKGHRTGNLLVAAEVTLSTVLLLAAGLLLHNFVAILGVNPGLKAQNLLTAGISLPPEKYYAGANSASFYQQLLAEANVLPGVKATGVVSVLPLTPDDNHNPVTAGDRSIPPMTQWPLTQYRYASSEYFQAVGIPFKDGRSFTERIGDTREVIISENLAERLWPGQNAVGRPLKIYGNRSLQTVVGVVGAVHGASLTQQPPMMVYFPSWNGFARDMSLVVRVEAEPANLVSAIRRIVNRLEPEAAIPSVQTMREIVSRSLAPQRFQLVLLASFAAVAILLAAMGIYGVLAFATSRRTSEIGIRMALGASATQILKSTLLRGMTPALAGLCAGLCFSAVFSRIFRAILFQVHPLDPLAYAGTTIAVIAVALLACVLPARRAAKLNPVETLRHQ